MTSLDTLKLAATSLRNALRERQLNPLGHRRSLDAVASLYGTDWNTLRAAPRQRLAFPDDLDALHLYLTRYVPDLARETSHALLLSLNLPPQAATPAGLLIYPESQSTLAPWPLLPSATPVHDALTLKQARHAPFSEITWKRDKVLQMGRAMYYSNPVLQDTRGQQLTAWLRQLQSAVQGTSHTLHSTHDATGAVAGVFVRKGVSQPPRAVRETDVAPLTLVISAPSLPGNPRGETTLSLAYNRARLGRSYLYVPEQHPLPNNITGYAAEALAGPCTLIRNLKEFRKLLRSVQPGDSLTLSGYSQDAVTVVLSSLTFGIQVILNTHGHAGISENEDGTLRVGTMIGEFSVSQCNVYHVNDSPQGRQVEFLTAQQYQQQRQRELSRPPLQVRAVNGASPAPDVEILILPEETVTAEGEKRFVVIGGAGTGKQMFTGGRETPEETDPPMQA